MLHFLDDFVSVGVVMIDEHDQGTSMFQSESSSIFGEEVHAQNHKCLLLSTFSTFQTPLTLLTNSAMGLNQLCNVSIRVLFYIW